MKIDSSKNAGTLLWKAKCKLIKRKTWFCDSINLVLRFDKPGFALINEVFLLKTRFSVDIIGLCEKKQKQNKKKKKKTTKKKQVFLRRDGMEKVVFGNK